MPAAAASIESGLRLRPLTRPREKRSSLSRFSRSASPGSGSDGKSSYIAVDAPGRFRVTIPAIAGYQPIDPFEVEIAAGEFVEREIQLVRKSVH